MKELLSGRSKHFGIILLVLSGIFIVTISYFNETCEGGGDNIWHYYFSKYAFQYPKFFLHHWGKPFFILLTAPVSQLGFYALNVFNIICGLLSAYVAFIWCRKLNFGFSYFAIVLTLFAPVYLAVIQSGLTEPLFGLLLIFSAYLLFCEKYFWGAVLASFLMYSRTEGVFMIVIFSSYLTLIRQFKFIPLFFTAFIIYSFIGFFSGHDFLWYFTELPYRAVSPYGKGTWIHFLRFNYSFSNTFVKCFILGFFILIRYIIINKEYNFIISTGPNFKIFCLVFIPSIAFFLFHVYAWATGKFASAGLERVFASVVPLASILCMYFLNLIWRIKFNLIRTVILIFITISLLKSTFRNYTYPRKATGPEKAEIAAAKWFKKYRQPNSTIFYAHPGIVFYDDYDPFDLSNRECFGFSLNNCTQEGVKGKFYYFWDNGFSDFACHHKQEDMEKCVNLKKIKEFKEEDFKLVVFESN